MDDLESVVSYKVDRKTKGKHTYTIGTKNQYHREKLDHLFTPTIRKRVKVSENEEYKLERDEEFDMDDLKNYLQGRGQVNIELDCAGTNARKIKTKYSEQKNGEFFKKLSKELHKLSRSFNKPMDELHMLFMDVSCDLELLKKTLKGEAKAKWSMLEDLAI